MEGVWKVSRKCLEGAQMVSGRCLYCIWKVFFEPDDFLYASLQVCNYAGIQVGRYASMQVCKKASMPVCKRIGGLVGGGGSGIKSDFSVLTRLSCFNVKTKLL